MPCHTSLGLSFQMHWPVRLKKGSVEFKPENIMPIDIPSTWKAMEALYDSGKARAIGVSNFSTKKLSDLVEVARVPPAVNQVECHPSWQQHKLHEFCKSKGIHLSVSSNHLTLANSLQSKLHFFPYMCIVAGIFTIGFSRNNMGESRCSKEPDPGNGG